MEEKTQGQQFLDIITGQESIKTDVNHIIKTEWKTVFQVAAAVALVLLVTRIISGRAAAK